MDLWIGTVALGLCVVCISTGNCPLIYIQLCIKELQSPWGNLRLGGLRKIHEGFWKNNCTWIALCSATPRYRLVKVLCTCPQWSKPPKIIWLNWMKPGLGQRWSVSLPPYNRSPRTGTGSRAVKAIDGRIGSSVGHPFQIHTLLWSSLPIPPFLTLNFTPSSSHHCLIWYSRCYKVWQPLKKATNGVLCILSTAVLRRVFCCCRSLCRTRYGTLCSDLSCIIHCVMPTTSRLYV